MDSTPNFVSPEQLAQILSCSSRTVIRYIEAGKLEAIKLGPKIIRLDLDKALKALQETR